MDKPSVSHAPSLTAAARDGASVEWPGRENASGGAELENEFVGV